MLGNLDIYIQMPGRATCHNLANVDVGGHCSRRRAGSRRGRNRKMWTGAAQAGLGEQTSNQLQ